MASTGNDDFNKNYDFNKNDDIELEDVDVDSPEDSAPPSGGAPTIDKPALTPEEIERKKERRRRKKEREAARALKEANGGEKLKKERSKGKLRHDSQQQPEQEQVEQKEEIIEMPATPVPQSTDQLNPLDTTEVKSIYDFNPHDDEDMDYTGEAVLAGEKEQEEARSKKSWTYIRSFILDSWGTILFTVIWVIFLICGATLLWPELSWQAWVTLIDIFLCITLLIKDLFPSHIVLLVAMVFLMACQIVSPKEALSGFSNDALITIVVLMIVAKGLEVTKAVDLITVHIFRSPKKVWDAQLRLTIPVAILSAFINNTPIVAMMIPAVEDWAFRTGVPVSKLMLPLSFCTVMGGVLSIIGTSTNLVVKGIVEEKIPDINIGFFEVGAAGLPVCIAGILYIIIGSRWLLPAHTTITEQYLKNPREYTLSVRVQKSSIAAGKSISTAGLRNLQGAYLFRIERGDQTFTAPDPETILQPDDVLTFAGVTESMKEILFYDGLVPATTQVDKITGKAKHRFLVEVVISPRSNLIGKSVLQSRFRQMYNAAIIGVSRSGERLPGNVAEVVFQAGDTLLVESGKAFLKYHTHDPSFSLVNQLTDNNGRKKVPLWKTIFTILCTLAMVAVSTAEVLPLVTAGLIVVCLFIMTRCVTLEEVSDAIRGDLIVLIATAFALGVALESTGAAEAISGSTLGFLAEAHRILLLGGVYILTVLLTAVFSNAGTVILLFPVCYSFVESGDMTIRALIFTLMLGGSCSFLTPIGYQTDLMVMGPGGYTFKDYMKFGVPLTILISIVAITAIHFIWNNV